MVPRMVLMAVRSSIGSSEVASVEESAATTSREQRKAQMWTWTAQRVVNRMKATPTVFVASTNDARAKIAPSPINHLPHLKGLQSILLTLVHSVQLARTRNVPGATLHQQYDPRTRPRPCVGSSLIAPTPTVSSSTRVCQSAVMEPTARPKVASLHMSRPPASSIPA